MKSKIINILLSITAIFLSFTVHAQDELDDYIKGSNYLPREDYDAFDENGAPKFRSREVAFVFLDFPDGRINGSEIPVTEEQLASVPNLEAVGELGQVKYSTP
jgi:hypothetical protein